MLFGSWMYYEAFRKNQMHFWVWGVVVCEAFSPRVPELTSPSPLSFSTPRPHFFLTKSPQKFRSEQPAKQTTFFPQVRASEALWLLGVTPLPNMHENVTVCLEAVCRACKFKPQSRDQRQTARSPQPERASWLPLVRQLHEPGAHWKNKSSAVKNTFLYTRWLLLWSYFHLMFWLVCCGKRGKKHGKLDLGLQISWIFLHQ